MLFRSQRNIRYYYVMDNEEVLLKNLYQVINKYNINKNDAEELTSIILSLIEDLIISDPMILITPDYQEHIIDNITNLDIYTLMLSLVETNRGTDLSLLLHR